MKCPNCGTENNDGVRFCKGCGASIQNVSAKENSGSGSKDNKNILIICVTVLLCVIILAGAFILMNDNSSSSNAVINDSSSSNEGMSFSEAKEFFPEASDTVLSHVFEEADSNHDGVLSDSEFSMFEKVRDHTKKYANNVKNEVSTVKPSSGERTGYCADHGRVAVNENDECPYCIDLHYTDNRTKTSPF